MSYFDWSEEKNQKLKEEREISFEEVVEAIEAGDLVDVVETPDQTKHKGQKMLVVKIDSYIYLVPFVEDGKKIFLKTVFPSRKATIKYLKEGRRV